MARPFGTLQSEETKRAISSSLCEQWASGVRKAISPKQITKNCNFCKKEMQTREKLLKMGAGKFCSKRCYAKSTIGRKLSDEHRAKLSIAKKGKIYSVETRRKMSESKKGKNSPVWKGGLPSCIECNNKLPTYKSKTSKCSKCYGNAWIVDRTQLKKSSEESKYRNSPAHKDWSKSVKNRDGWKCRISNDNCSGRLEAHHILGWKDHPELRYQINNGISLCHAHHPRRREDEQKMVFAFQQLVAEMTLNTAY